MVNHQMAPFPQGTREIQALPAKKAPVALPALQEYRDLKEQKVSLPYKVIRWSRD